MLEVLEREVLQLALERVESELVGQWRIEIAGFLRHLVLCLLVGSVAYLSHDIDAVGDHDEDDAHVFGKGEQEVAEVVAFDDRVFVVEMLYLLQSVHDVLHAVAVASCHVGVVGGLAGIEQCGDDAVSAQPYLVDADACGLHGGDDGIESESIAVHLALADGHAQVVFQLAVVVG